MAEQQTPEKGQEAPKEQTPPPVQETKQEAEAKAQAEAQAKAIQAEVEKERIKLEAEFQEHKRRFQQSQAKRQALQGLSKIPDLSQYPAEVQKLLQIGQMTAQHWEMEGTLESLGAEVDIDDERLVKDQGLDAFVLSAARIAVEESSKKVKMAEDKIQKAIANLEEEAKKIVKEERVKAGLEKVETTPSQTPPEPETELAQAVQAVKEGRMSPLALAKIRKQIGG